MIAWVIKRCNAFEGYATQGRYGKLIDANLYKTKKHAKRFLEPILNESVVMVQIREVKK